MADEPTPNQPPAPAQEPTPAPEPAPAPERPTPDAPASPPEPSTPAPSAEGKPDAPAPAKDWRALLDEVDPKELLSHPRVGGIVGSRLQAERERAAREAEA